MTRPLRIAIRVALVVCAVTLGWLGMELRAYHPREAGACLLVAAANVLVLMGITSRPATSEAALPLPPLRRAGGRRFCLNPLTFLRGSRD